MHPAPRPSRALLHISPCCLRSWDRLAAAHGDRPALLNPHASPPAALTFAQLAAAVRRFAGGLQALGLAPGDRVALFSENSARWLVADQGVMAAGAADAVRGAGASLEEAAHILAHSGAAGVVVQDGETLDRLLPALAGAGARAEGGDERGGMRFAVVLWGEPSAAAAAALSALSVPALSYEQVVRRGQAAGFAPPPPPAAGTGAAAGEALATLVYTSGTSGAPKGVALTHANILYQVESFDAFIAVAPGDTTLSLLPPWCAPYL